MDVFKNSLAQRDGYGFVLPRIPVSALCDVLGEHGYRVGLRPQDSDRSFVWCNTLSDTDPHFEQIDDQDILYVAEESDFANVLAEHPESLVLLITASIEPSDALSAHRDRVIQVIDADPNVKMGLSVLMQGIILSMLRWENQLNFITATNGTVESLLNLGSKMFGGFVMVVGIDYRIIATSSGTGYPNDEYRTMCESEGILRQDCISTGNPDTDALGFEAKMSGRIVDEWGNSGVARPISFNQSVFGAVVLLVEDRSSLKNGISAQFSHFVRYVTALCSTNWSKGIEKDIPHYYFLSALLSGKQFSKSSIETSLRGMDIPAGARFKVVALDMHGATQGADVLSEAMRNLNHRRVATVVFKNYVVALLYSEGPDDTSSLSQDRTAHDVRTYVHVPYGLVCGISQVFENVQDASLAFRQACYALRYRSDYLREIRVTDGSEAIDADILASTTFEQVFPYFLVDMDNPDKEFVDFCFDRSFLDMLLEEDLKNDTQNFQTLWYFLAYDRNASLVGRRMYMHRNTVLYHIKQIEKRYDFSLSKRYYREKIMYDYRALFRTLDDDMLNNLFAK